MSLAIQRFQLIKRKEREGYDMQRGSWPVAGLNGMGCIYICSSFNQRAAHSTFFLHNIHPHTSIHATMLELPCEVLTCPTTWATVTPHSSASLLMKRLVTASFQDVQKREFSLKGHITCPWQHILTVACVPLELCMFYKRTIGEGGSYPALHYQNY